MIAGGRAKPPGRLSVVDDRVEWHQPSACNGPAPCAGPCRTVAMAAPQLTFPRRLALRPTIRPTIWVSLPGSRGTWWTRCKT
jgi:hypothetical protein